MRLENELFRRLRPNIQRLIEYGFIEQNGIFQYQTRLEDTGMYALITVDNNAVFGSVLDEFTDEEYIAVHTIGKKGNFASKVRTAYLSCLEDIAKNCFEKRMYSSDQANTMHEWMINQLHDTADHPFTKSQNSKRTVDNDFTAYKPNDCDKMYALMFTIGKRKLDKTCDDEYVDAVNIKVEPSKVEDLLQLHGFYPAYHMNKKHWVTAILDDTIKDETLKELLLKARDLVGNRLLHNHYWVIPANPAVYDIDAGFVQSDLMYWKQKLNYQINDYVFIYYGMPFGELRYLCKVVERDIVFHDDLDKESDNEMFICLQKIHFFEDHQLTRNFISNFGLTNIRGARSMPQELINQIYKMYPTIMI